jgi:hypothetical protein
MEKIDWELFQKQFNSMSTDVQAQMIADNLSCFDTKPDWVVDKVWGMALRVKG